jgi:hypothetical protein
MSPSFRLDLTFASAYETQAHESLCESVNDFVDLEFVHPDRVEIYNVRFVQQRGHASDFHGSVWLRFLRKCRRKA